MAKPMLIGLLASAVVGAITGVALIATDANGNVGGTAFVLAACIAGLIGAKVTQHLPPARRQR